MDKSTTMQRFFIRLSRAIVFLVATCAGAHAEAGDDAGVFSLFSPAFSGIGKNKLAEVAVRFPGGIFGSQDPVAIHRANPSAKAYRYQLGPYIQIKHVPQSLVPSSHPFYAEAGTARDLIAESALVRQGADAPQPGLGNWPRNFPPYLVVVPDDPAWLAYLDAIMPEHVANYDGLFLDSMGPTPVVTSYLVTKPINPRTHQPYTVAEWFAAENKMIDRIKKHLKPGQVLLMQGLVNGDVYFGPDSIRPLLEKCDGGMAEMIYRGPQNLADRFPSPQSWLNDVKMIADLAAKGKSGYFWTKAWVPLTEAQRTQWLRFVLCSHLLGAGRHSYLNFDSHNEPVAKGRGNNADPAEYYAEYDTARKLGNAVEAMSPVGGAGAYRRRWQQGWVYVNPTAKPEEIKLGKAFEDLDGKRVSGTVTLLAHSGQIFLETE